LLDDDAFYLSNELSSIHQRTFPLYLRQPLHALANDGRRDEIAPPTCGRGLIAWAEGKGVYLAEPGVPGDVNRGLEIVLRLAGKADDDVGADRGPVESTPNAIEHAHKGVARVLTIHLPQRLRAAGL
jgi:hypothetical protein